MSDSTVKYITPPKSLRKKQIDAGVALNVNVAMIDAAEKSVSDMKSSYLDWVGGDLNKLHAACEAAIKDPANRAAHIQELYNTAVEIKGQGGSFGYPLITTIGSQLCRFIESMGNDVSDAKLDVVRIHVETLRLVIQQKMEGDGGAMGQKLLTGLTLALKKVAG